MSITVAKSAGFCFGVTRAVDLVYRLLDEGKKVCTLGPIIHNDHVVKDLEARGVCIAGSVDDVPDGYMVVIRSHGVGRPVYEAIEKRGLHFADATCPFVSKIHHIVAERSGMGEVILIAGDENHPEVQGVRGHCRGKSYVFRDAGQLEELVKSHPEFGEKGISIVAQTTFSLKEWKKCLEGAKKVYTNAVIFDTICNATGTRQMEAEQLAAQSDLMIIVGGRQSSNTEKLRSVCAAHCETVLIEEASELPVKQVRRAGSIGVTAGASTPASIIKEVLQAMSEIVNNEMEKQEPVEQEAPQKSFDEMTFEEALEASLKNLNTGEKVKGVVVSIAPNEIQVDVGRKQAGYVPLSELTSDPNAKPEDIVKVGDEIELLIMRTNDQEGTIMLSKRRLDAAKGWEEIVDASENGTIMEGTVTEIIKGGLLAVCNNVKVFIPASQATMSRGEPLEDLLRKKVQFRIIEINRNRKRAVGSIRSVLKDQRKELEDKFWESVEVGAHYTGTVKSLTSYGAFVDIGGVDGMIHVSELSWSRIKHPSEVVKVGDTVDVYIKEIDPEKRRISLGYRKAEDNPWEILKRDYPVGTVCDVKIVGMTQFGAFAQIIPGIDGLIHISQIADRRVGKPQDVLSVGQVVKAKITDIDFEKKRISLSIRVLIEEGILDPADFEDKPEVAAEKAEEEAADAPAEE